MNPLGAIQVAVIVLLAIALGAKILAQSRHRVRSIVLGKASDDALSRLEPPYGVADRMLLLGRPENPA